MSVTHKMMLTFTLPVKHYRAMVKGYPSIFPEAFLEGSWVMNGIWCGTYWGYSPQIAQMAECIQSLLDNPPDEETLKGLLGQESNGQD